MNKSFVWWQRYVALGVLSLSSALYAQNTAATPSTANSSAAPLKPATLKETGKAGESLKGLKLAFVDTQAVILQTEEGKFAREQIEKEFKKKQEELIAIQKELKKMEEDFQAQFSVLSDEAKLNKQKEFQQKLLKLQQLQATYEQEIREKESKETQKILQKISAILEELVRKANYDLVFEKGSGALLWAARIDDLTDELVKEYNKRYPVKR